MWGKASPLYDKKGDIIGVIESIRDVTERKQTEDLYKTMVNDLQIGLYILIGGKVVFANQHMPRYSGYPMTELLGAEIIKYVHSDDRNLVRENSVQMLKGERSKPYEFRIIDKSGHIKWLMETVSSISYQGQSTILGNTMDITEQKRIQEELQIKDNAIKSSITPIIIADLDTRLTYANDAFLVLWGYETIEDVIGTRVRDYWLDSAAMDCVMDHLKKEEGWVGELVARKKDGTTLDVQVTASVVMGDDNSSIALMASFADMSEKKQSEEAIRQLQKMEAIGTLAGGIAHDFNNILMGIQGHNALMLLDVEKTHPFYDHLKRQEAIVASGARLSRQILDFAHGGKYEVALVNLNDIVIKSLDMFGRTKKEVSIKHDLHPDI